MNEYLLQVHPDLHSPVPQQHVLDLSHLLHVRTVPGDNSSDVSHSNHLVNSSTGSVKVATSWGRFSQESGKYISKSAKNSVRSPTKSVKFLLSF